MTKPWNLAAWKQATYREDSVSKAPAIAMGLFAVAVFTSFWCTDGSGSDYIAGWRARDAEPVVPMYWSTDVQVMNVNGSGAFAFGQPCFAMSRDPVERVKVDGTEVLVRLRSATHSEAWACPAGTLFLVPAWQYTKNSDEIRDEKARAAEARARAERLVR